MNPAQAIRRAAQMYAGNVAVWCEGREQTYAQMFERACRLANVFRAQGAKPGDRVAVLCDNAFQTVELAAACALGNYPRATLYTYNQPSVNRYLLELTGATIFVVQRKYHEALVPLLAGLPNLKAVIVFDGEATDGALAYDQVLAEASPEDVDVPVADDDVHIIRFSSGTTGKPKGIAHSVGRWMQVTNEWRWVTPMVTEQSRYLCPIALAHLGVALLWGMLAVGACIVPMPEFNPRRTLELIESLKITHAVAAPVMIREMLAEPSCRSRDLSSLQCLMYAGSPIASNTLRAAIEVFGNSLFQLYAQSETMAVTMLLPHQHVTGGSEAETRRLRSVGRPTPNSRVTIRDDDGNVLPPDTIGEVAVHSPGLMSGLWNDAAGTAARTLPDGSLLTRDMGYMDADGFVYLVDRKDDMIVSGGYNVWPTELEEALCSHPAVAEACVFGVPDEKWGETPKAVVVLRPGAQATAEELMAHTRGIVGGVKKVTSVDFIAVLPRTSNGKVMRAALTEPHWAGRGSRIAGS
ncbi:MAG: AMP-binding protein [Burkholderiales bacterium]